MKETFFDELLNVETVGEQRGFYDSLHYHRYEPTPYQALEQLFKQYELKSSDRVVDFGCGKGRLNFFINHLFDASVVGIEMNETFYQAALANRDSYVKKKKSSSEKIHFQCCLAQEYDIQPNDNIFYFFNPFSVQIFMKVVDNILRSVEEVYRDVKLIFYYGSEDYIYFLENHYAFERKEEIVLPGLYEKNVSEKFLIYTLSY